jgi:hypothetical protein
VENGILRSIARLRPARNAPGAVAPVRAARRRLQTDV